MSGERLETSARLGEQLRLFIEDADAVLNARLWAGSFNAKESSLHQLAPYIGKMKSGMVHVLVELYSQPGDTVLDPFCGSGVVPLECLLMGRNTIGNDLSPYACVLTRGKLSAPAHKSVALQEAHEAIEEAERIADSIDLASVTEWVSVFFHPDTLRETLATFQVLKERENYFLTACLLGILHHVRPGFLSYPSSHLTPYLRMRKYPPAEFPSMYRYRDVRSRLLAKVARAYRRPMLPASAGDLEGQVLQENAMNLPLPSDSVDAVITSPPYFGALDYARDNRLRLWFLGISDWKSLDQSLTASDRVYVPQMRCCLSELHRVLKVGGYCVLVVGDVERNGTKKNTARILSELALEASDGRLETELVYTDEIPDIRRSRRQTRTTKYERILVLRKTGAPSLASLRSN